MKVRYRVFCDVGEYVISYDCGSNGDGISSKDYGTQRGIVVLRFLETINQSDLLSVTEVYDDDPHEAQTVVYYRVD